ncbi:DNA pilot protein [Dipodfec virus UOA04_Rod_558]|nr:DNA pilot protein [Dipodfec virus UOA04_Rod_558]
MLPLVVTALGAAGIAAGASALLGAGASVMSAKLNFRQTRNLMKYQNQLNQENWMMNNEYNSPLNQRSRLLEAGLNPNLASDGMAQTSPIGDAGLGSAPGVDLGAGLPGAQESFGAMAGLENTIADTELKKALKATEDALRSGKIELLGVEIDVSKWTANKSKAEIEKMAVEVEKFKAEIDTMGQQVQQEWQRLTLEERQVKVNEALEQIQRDLADSKISRDIAEIAQQWIKTNADAANSYSQANLYTLQGKGQQIQNMNDAIDLGLKIDNGEAYADAYKSGLEQPALDAEGKKLENENTKLLIDSNRNKAGLYPKYNRMSSSLDQEFFYTLNYLGQFVSGSAALVVPAGKR